MIENTADEVSSLRRAIRVLKALADQKDGAMRLTDVARAVGCNQPTAHRALRELAAEGFVEQVAGGKRYQLGLGFFVAAANANCKEGLRDLARPALLRVSSTLSDTVFLLVRSVYDAVCIDRIEGPFPIRSFTGDVGGKVPLGLGQGSLALLAHLPEEEREAVIRYNMPRLLDRGYIDEAAFRAVVAKAREEGSVTFNTGLIPGMGGVAVPIFDARGYAVAAISIGTLAERLQGDRLPIVVDILKKEAAELGRRINPFDPTLRSPARSLHPIS